MNNRFFLIANRRTGRVVYQGNNRIYADNCWARVHFDTRLSYYEYDRSAVERSFHGRGA